MIAYLAFTFGLAAFFGYFTDLVLSQAGMHVPWPVYAAVGIVLVALLGYRTIDLSSAILGALMIGEVVILAIFDASVIAAKGVAVALPAHALAPSLVLTPGLGVSLMVAFTCFLGFESAALYGEEARDPQALDPDRHLHARSSRSPSSTSSPPGWWSARSSLRTSPRAPTRKPAS